MADNLGNMLNTIKNATLMKHEVVLVPYTLNNFLISKILYEEHSKIRRRFVKAKGYGMEVPMVRWAITNEEYNSAEALLDKWRTEEGENSLDLHSPSGQEGNDDDSDANSDVEEL